MAKIVCPLLTGLVMDHSKKLATGMVAGQLAPVVMVDESVGAFREMGKESGVVPETAIAANGGKARNVSANYADIKYNCEDHALKESIDNAKLIYKNGPFVTAEQNTAKRLTKQLLLARERRLKVKVSKIDGSRKTVLSASAPNNRLKLWNAGGGDPVYVLELGIDNCDVRPNTLMLPEPVYNLWTHHPKMIAYLGEMNMIKKITVERIQELFDIEKVIIAKGKIGKKKRKFNTPVTMGSIWANMVVLAYVSEEEDEPCAMKTFTLKQKSIGGQEFISRKWDENDGGMEGARVVQVGHSIHEKILYPEMMHVITW